MATLYLSEPGAKLRLLAGRLQVEKRDQLLADLPSQMVDEVVLLGGTQVTTQAMRDLLGRQVPLHLLTQAGSYLGRLEPAASGKVELLKTQVHRADDPAFSLQTARILVEAKVWNSQVVLKRLARNRSHQVLQEATDFHQAALRDIPGVDDLEWLRGLEGMAAQHYFAALSKVIPAQWNFTGRNRNPPKDDANALLSFGYGLLKTQVLSAMQRVGLHPGIGFLHVSHGARPALALDLMEEYRAVVVDRLVLSLIGLRQMNPSHFENIDGGRLLNESGRKRFLRAFEGRLAEEVELGDSRIRYRELFVRQARAFAQYLRSGQPYQPLRLR